MQGETIYPHAKTCSKACRAEANRERKRECDRRYYEANRERKRQYRAANREYMREYRARNRELILQRNYEYYANNREALCQYTRDRERKASLAYAALQRLGAAPEHIPTWQERARFSYRVLQVLTSQEKTND